MSATLSQNKRRLLDRYLQGQPERSRIAPRPPGPDAPLSCEQELIWLHSQLAPELPLYNEILTLRRVGPLDVPALERSLGEVVRRHEAWRTTFEAAGGAARQIVQPPPVFGLPVTDLTSLPEAEREQAALRLATDEARRPLDLARGPLVRVKLVRMAEAEHRLYVILHQIIHDGVSVYSVFAPELIAIYQAFAAGRPSPLPEPTIQYSDFACWQRREVEAASVDYWRAQLHGAPAALELPADRARPVVQSFRGRQHAFTIPREVSGALKRLSQTEGVTLFMTLLAAFCVLLHRHGGRSDLVVGTAISTRTRPELERLLGIFLNTIVLRVRLAESLGFRELLARVKEVVLDGLAHGDVPFQRLVKELVPRRDPGRNPLYQVTFVLEPPMPPLAPGWDVTQMDVDTGIARVDLYLQMDDRPEGLVGHVRYNADLWEASTIARLAERFGVLLHGIVADPARPIGDLPILTEADRCPPPGTVRPRNAFEPFEAAEIEGSIPQRFAKQVARDPDRIAVRTGNVEWTYARLDGAARKVARSIAGRARVALLLPHDAPMVAGILGVLAGGAAYVPLDPNHPRERLGEMLVDSLATAVLTSREHRVLAEALAPPGMTILDVVDVLRGPPARPPARSVSPDDLAYVLYTSGSTGRPKPVVQNHRNVLHFIAAYTQNLHLCPDDRLALLASYSVDAAVMDIFGALLNGATLCPIDVREVGLDGVHERLIRDGVTVYHSTPTLFRHLCRELAGRPPPRDVRLVVLGGEEARREDFDSYWECFPDAMLVNGLGPTESTVSLQCFMDARTTPTRRSLPIGRPVERTRVSLLSDEGRPDQVYGELAIESRHVALGKGPVYRTGDMARLLPDGSLEFCGRKDLQTKLQGFRVELGEIEAALSRHPAVNQVAVAVGDTPAGEKRLIAHWVGTQGSSDELRRFLRDRLPGYMIPSAFVRAAALPLTSSGKLDRRALPDPGEPQPVPNLAPPRDDVERRLADIWTRVLGVTGVGIRDDFFDLGGHSLLALRMVAEIESMTGVRVPLGTLVEAPTIERLAEHRLFLARHGQGTITTSPGDSQTSARSPSLVSWSPSIS